MSSDGCPVCDWDGEVAVTHNRKSEYYTHVIVRNGELLKGRTCTRRTDHQRPDYIDVSRIETDLTPRQFEILRLAYKSGYFEWPRETNGSEVAELVGISQPTFSRHIRTAQQKLLSLLFDDNVD